MLVNFKEMLEKAADSDYAIPGFNVFGYEDAIAVIEAAEELNVTSNTNVKQRQCGSYAE